MNTDALTDGLLFTRYMFGSRGDALIDNAVATDCTRCSAADIEPLLAQCSSSLASDIDGNGEVDALTDGLLLTRLPIRYSWASPRRRFCRGWLYPLYSESD